MLNENFNGISQLPIQVILFRFGVKDYNQNCHVSSKFDGVSIKIDGVLEANMSLRIN